MCHLPVNNSQEEKAFFKVLSYLRKLKDQGIGVSGWTTSTLRPAVFHGWWWSEQWEEWVRDDLVLCFVDYRLSLDGPFSERACPGIKADHQQVLSTSSESAGRSVGRRLSGHATGLNVAPSRKRCKGRNAKGTIHLCQPTTQGSSVGGVGRLATGACLGTERRFSRSSRSSMI